MWKSLLTLAAAVALALGHGRVLSPPGRGTLWRAGFPQARPNYDDDGLNCGGVHQKESAKSIKCGICGDPYYAAKPRPHERGGIYDSGIISATYEAGSIFTAKVQLTAHHKGYWEFKLCPDPDNADQACFDANPIELEAGGTKYYPRKGSTTYSVKYRLPKGLTCEHCVLQWRYRCGNNWGKCNNGTERMGCGSQETFGACSDIAITGGSSASAQYVSSPLRTRMADLDLITLTLNNYMEAYYQSQTTTAPPRRQVYKKRRKHKGKKKVKPYKTKWITIWRQRH